MESKAILSMADLLTDGSFGQEIVNLWEEYDAGLTPEAKVVKDLDKFDMILQAFEYEQKEETPGRLEEFFESTKGVFKTEKVKQWVEALSEKRESSKSDSSTT